MNDKFKKFLYILLLFTLSACEQICIDPDDFGFPKISVSARPEVDSEGKDTNIFGEQENQVIKWKASGYQITGQRLSIMVRNGDNSRWSPWYGTGTDPFDNIPEVVRNASVCSFTDAGMCPDPSAKYIKLANVSDDAPNDPNNSNTACYFNRGLGLYGLITNEDPNKNEMTLRALPSDARTFHLGENLNLFKDTKIGDGVPNSDNQLAYESTGGYNDYPPAGSTLSGNLYFKILDNFYDDNGGQYKLIVKSGIESTSLGPISKVIKLVQDTFNKASEQIYKNVVKESHFIKDVTVLLTLYIILQAILFLFGVTQMSQAQFAIHIFKMAIIMQLISTSSWTFFNDTVFSFFTKGVNQMICIVTSSDSACSPETMFTPFDKMVEILISKETWAKMSSLLFVNTSGLVILPIFCVIIYFFFIALFKAVIFFLLAFVVTSLLIILAPIFISFILFKFTFNLFNNWLNQLFSYFIQPILIFAALALWMNIIITQLQKLLGFRVCVNDWFFIKPWSPRKPHLDPEKDLQWIYAPGTFTNPLSKDKICQDVVNCDQVSGNTELLNIYNNLSDKYSKYSTDKVCGPYECLDLRFPDLPFMQPYIDADWQHIQQVASGTFVSITEVLMFSLLIGLMYLFNNMVPEIARAMAGSGGIAANLTDATQSAYMSVHSHTKSLMVDYVWKNSKQYLPKDVIRTLGWVDKKYQQASSLAKTGASAIGGALETVDPTRLGRKIPLIKGFYGDEMYQSSTDKLGGKIDAVTKLNSNIKKQVLYDTSYGLFGSNVRDQKMQNGEEKFAQSINEYSKQFNLNDKQSDEVTKYVNNLTDSTKSASNWGKAAVAVSIINPFVGTIIGGYSIYKAGKAALTAVQSMKDLQGTTTRNP